MKASLMSTPQTEKASESVALFSASPAHKAGFTQGLGLGLILAVIAVQLPNDYMTREGGTLFTIGAIAFAYGSYKTWQNYQEWKKSQS